MDVTYKVLVGDCIEQMRTLPDESVHMIATSPPYWGLRQYLFDNAVVLREDISSEELTFVLTELAKHGIKPKLERDV